jgi:PAS domain S-box-containing protein
MAKQMAKRITLLLLAGLGGVLVLLTLILGGIEYASVRGTVEREGRYTARLGSELYSSILEHAIDAGIFAEEAVFKGQAPDSQAEFAVTYEHYLRSSIRDTIRRMVQQDMIYYVYGVSMGGFVPYHSNPQYSRQILRGPRPGTDQGEVGLREQHEPDGFRYLEFYYPIMVHGRLWGEFRVGIASAWLYRRVLAGILAFSLPTLLMFSLLAFMIYRVVKHSMRPLLEMADIADCMAAGDFDVSLPTYNRQDELGRVARSFNGMVATVKVTRQRLEDSVQNRTAMLDAFIEHAPSAIIIVDEKSQQIVRVNRRAAAIAGYPAQQLVGRTYQEAFVIIGVTIWRPVSGEDDHEGAGVECQIRSADGTLHTVVRHRVYIELNESPFRLETLSDISDIKRLQHELVLQEQQTRHAQKMEAIGQLAAGIAHEINTPSQFVGDNLRFLADGFEDMQKALRRYEEIAAGEDSGSGRLEQIAQAKDQCDLAYLDEEIPKAIEQSLDGVQRVAAIVSAMKEFSHPGSGDVQPVDLNRTIHNTVVVARNEWKYYAEMELKLCEGLPPVPCHIDEINQVLLNLVVNAAHAVKDVLEGQREREKGRITIETSMSGDWVEIRVSDTGTGIPENVRDRIYDPFFTTKEVGRGTGQGLSIAYDVIKRRHGGELTFTTEMGVGTTFCIRLPLQRTVQIKDTTEVRDG